MEFPEISWVAVQEEIESIETVRTSGKLYKVFPASQAKEISHDLAGAVALLKHLQECAVESGQYTKKEIYGE
jgi:hypothetical protein